MLDYRAHTFIIAYRLQSFTRAAEELHITQPAVSQHIKQLEARVGCSLFETRGRAIRSTPAGDYPLWQTTKHVSSMSFVGSIAPQLFRFA